MRARGLGDTSVALMRGQENVIVSTLGVETYGIKAASPTIDVTEILTRITTYTFGTSLMQ